MRLQTSKCNKATEKLFQSNTSDNVPPKKQWAYNNALR